MRLDLVFECWAEEYRTKGHYAVDKTGVDVPPKDPAASKWCAVGWMDACGVPSEVYSEFDRWLRARVPCETMIDLNDRAGWSIRKFNQEWKIFLGSDTFRAIGVDMTEAAQLPFPTQT